jgi:hypothetical protein
MNNVLPVTPYSLYVNTQVVQDWFTPTVTDGALGGVSIRITSDVVLIVSTEQLKTLNRLINNYIWENLETEDEDNYADVWDERIDSYAEASLFGEE